MTLIERLNIMVDMALMEQKMKKNAKVWDCYRRRLPYDDRRRVDV